MNVLLRVLGLNLLAHVGSRLPSRTARTTTSILLIAANLLPLVAVLTGAAGVGDVFVIYWFENVVVWFTSTIKILTARGGMAGDVQLADNVLTAAFFAFHFGMFTLVHGVFSFILAGMTGGLTGEPRTWVLLAPRSWSATWYPSGSTGSARASATSSRHAGRCRRPTRG